YPWAGGLILATVAALLCAGSGAYILAVSGTRPQALHLVPGVLLLVLHNRYTHHLATSLALLVAVLGVCLYLWMRGHGPWWRLLGFLILSGIVYYVAAGAFLIYAVLCGIFELLRKQHCVGVLCLVCAFALPYVAGSYVLPVRLSDAYGRLLPFHREGDPSWAALAACLYAFLPLAALSVAFGRWLTKGARSASVDGAAAGAGAFRQRHRHIRSVVTSVLVLIAGAVAVCLSLDRDAKALLQMEYCIRTGAWTGVLEAARRVPADRYGLNVSWDVNRALYHTGRLRDEMFSYPQDGLSLRPPDPVAAPLDLSQTACMEYSDVLFDLGRVNESERAAYMALEYLGERPAILQRLALLSVARGEAEAARILLGALSQDLILAGWARRYLARLGKDPSLSADEEIGRLRSVMVTEDKVGTPPFEDLLLDLLRSNRHNRMAFEYLMAHYLLSRDLEGVARNIGRLDDFGHRDIPKHYEEAIVLHMAGTDSEVDLRGRSIRWETLSRFTEFCKMRDRHSGDRRRAWDALAKDYGDTYFFYYTFGSSGGTE
ncbi:MAG: hypothetical protein KAX44_09000, partial [Candidatus Brocadiae bacterium]|nr:hypothetical protein [Candidatus Brocadiia bacterium]